MTSSPALSVMVLLTPLVTTRWDVEATVTVSAVTTPSVTLFLKRLSLLLWAPQEKLQGLFQTPLLALQTSSSPTGSMVIQRLLTSMSFLLSSLSHSLTLSEAARTQGHALQVGVQRKLASNLPSCRSVGMTCIPLVAETLGGLAEDFISTIRDIGRSICLRSGADRHSVTIKHLFERVSIALWRGNASMLIYRSPTLSPVLDGHT